MAAKRKSLHCNYCEQRRLHEKYQTSFAVGCLGTILATGVAALASGGLLAVPVLILCVVVWLLGDLLQLAGGYICTNCGTKYQGQFLEKLTEKIDKKLDERQESKKKKTPEFANVTCPFCETTVENVPGKYLNQKGTCQNCKSEFFLKAD